MGDFFGGGGNDGPSAPSYRPPPAPIPWKDIIDEITGVKYVNVKKPDGGEERVLTRLPRTPEKQALYEKLDAMVPELISNIQNLYKYAPQELVPYQGFIESFANLNQEQQRNLAEVANIGNIAQDIKNFKQMNRSILDAELERGKNITNAEIAKRGWKGSSFDAQFQASRNKEEARARQQLEVESTVYGQKLARERFDLNKEAFGLNQQGRHSRLAQGQMQLGLQQEEMAQKEAKRQRAMQEQSGILGTVNTLQQQELAKEMGSAAPQLGNNTWSMENQDQMNRYNSSVAAENMAFQNANMVHQNKGPSLGAQIATVGGGLAGNMAGPMFSGVGAAGGKYFGQKIFG